MTKRQLYDSIIKRRADFTEMKSAASVYNRAVIGGYIEALNWVLEEIVKSEEDGVEPKNLGKQ